MYLVISASVNEEKKQILCSCFNGLAYTVCVLLNKMCLTNSQAVFPPSSSSFFFYTLWVCCLFIKVTFKAKMEKLQVACNKLEFLQFCRSVIKILT